MRKIKLYLPIEYKRAIYKANRIRMKKDIEQLRERLRSPCASCKKVSDNVVDNLYCSETCKDDIKLYKNNEKIHEIIAKLYKTNSNRIALCCIKEKTLCDSCLSDFSSYSKRMEYYIESKEDLILSHSREIERLKDAERLKKDIRHKISPEIPFRFSLITMGLFFASFICFFMHLMERMK